VAKVEEELYATLDSEYKDLMKQITEKEIDDKMEEKMNQVCKKVIEKF
jgi:F0F1-type ATP synthase alpha subunit